MAEFNRQNEMSKFKEDMLNDALADAFDESDVEEEADMATSQVLAEPGVELDSNMAGLDATSKAPPTKGGKSRPRRRTRCSWMRCVARIEGQVGLVIVFILDFGFWKKGILWFTTLFGKGRGDRQKQM